MAGAVLKVTGVNVSDRTARRAANRVLSGSLPTPSAQFLLLNSLLEALERDSPGTVARVDVNEDDQFLRFFVAPNPTRNFVQHAFPIVGVDAADMKSLPGIYLYLCVGIDAEHRTSVIAWGLGPCESYESWSSFINDLMAHLTKDDTPLPEGFTIISDRDSGIKKAVAAHEGVHHAHCAEHVARNVQTNAGGGSEGRRLVQAAAGATNEATFTIIMDALRELKESAADYLAAQPRNRALSDPNAPPRAGVKNNNLTESKNAQVRGLRKGGPINLVSKLWHKEAKNFYERHQQANAEPEMSLPGFTAKLLDQTAQRAKGLQVTPSLTPEGDVALLATVCRDGYSPSNIVQLSMSRELQGCDCGYWKQWGAPCEHAWAALEYYRDAIVDVENRQQLYESMVFASVVPHRLNISLRQAYSVPYPPVKFPGIVETVEDNLKPENLVLPPADAGRGRGRPRTKRIHSRGDVTASSRGGGPQSWTHLPVPQLLAKINKTEASIQAKENLIKRTHGSINTQARAVAAAMQSRARLQEQGRNLLLGRANKAVADAEAARDLLRIELADTVGSKVKQEELLARLKYQLGLRRAGIEKKSLSAIREVERMAEKAQKRREAESRRNAKAAAEAVNRAARKAASKAAKLKARAYPFPVLSSSDDERPAKRRCSVNLSVKRIVMEDVSMDLDEHE